MKFFILLLVSLLFFGTVYGNNTIQEEEIQIARANAISERRELVTFTAFDREFSLYFIQNDVSKALANYKTYHLEFEAEGVSSAAMTLQDGEIYKIFLVTEDQGPLFIEKQSQENDAPSSPQSNNIEMERDSIPPNAGFYRIFSVRDAHSNPQSASSMEKKVKKGLRDVNLVDGLPLSPPPGPCPSTTKILPVSFAADYTYTKAAGGASSAQAEIVSLVNAASQLFESTLNIRLELQEIAIQQLATEEPAWNAGCSSLQKKLQDFTLWRRSQNPSGLWHLLTDCYPSGGLSWNAVACLSRDLILPASAYQSLEVVGNTGISTWMKGQGQLYSIQQLAFNLGAAHDSFGIMVDGKITDTTFSRASQDQMCVASGNLGCLISTDQNVAKKSIRLEHQAEEFSSSTLKKNDARTTTTNATLIADILSLVNQERATYGLNPVVWSETGFNVLVSFLSSCDVYALSALSGDFSLYETSYFGASNGLRAYQVVAEALEKGRASYACISDACPGPNPAECEFYRKLMFADLATLACSSNPCSSASFSDSPYVGSDSSDGWDFAACTTSPEGPAFGDRPFPDSACPRVPGALSCSAAGLECGFYFNGQEELDCGACGAPYFCSAEGLCECEEITTCESLGLQCGSMTTNCGRNVWCGGPSCQPCQPKYATPALACEAQNIKCGTVWDGCRDITCGGCTGGSRCNDGQCEQCSVACSTWANCHQGDSCVCKPGYQGDGFTCSLIPEPIACNALDWTGLAGASSSYFKSALASFEARVCSFTHPARSDRNSAYDVLIWNEFTHDPNSGDATWAVDVTRTAGDAGIVVGASGNKYMRFFWDDQQQTFVFEAIFPGLDFRQTLGTWSAHPDFQEWAAGTSKILSVQVLANGYVLPSVNGAPWRTFHIAGWPSQTTFGLVASSNGEATFQNFVLSTATRLVVNLWGELSADDVRELISSILGVPPQTIQNVELPPVLETNSSAPRARSFALAPDPTPTTTVSFTLSGDGASSGSALATSLSTTLSKGVVAPASSVPTVVPAIPASSIPAPVSSSVAGGASGGGLSGGAIAGIVVGSVVGGVLLIVLTGGLIAVVARGGQADEDQPNEPNRRRTILQRMSIWRPKGGVNLDPAHNPSGHKSLTARMATGYN